MLEVPIGGAVRNVDIGRVLVVVLVFRPRSSVDVVVLVMFAMASVIYWQVPGQKKRVEFGEDVVCNGCWIKSTGSAGLN